MRYFRTLTAITMIAAVSGAFANSPMTLVPSDTSITVRSDGSAVASYTLTNTIATPLADITIDPAFGGGNANHVSLQNNTCGATLASLASCTFQVLVGGVNQSTSFTLSPRACAFNGITCVVSPADFRPTVTVLPVTHPVTAYYAMTSGPNVNTLIPVNVATNTAGTPIPGFDFVGSFLNSLSNTAVAAVPVGVAVSPDGNAVYVADRANMAVGIVNVTTTPATVTSVGLAGFTSSLAIPLVVPGAVAVTPNNQALYIPMEDANQIIVVNVASAAVEEVIDIPSFTSDSVACTLDKRNKAAKSSSPAAFYAATVSPDGKTAYTIPGGNIVTATNTTSFALDIVFCTSSSNPSAIAVSPDNTLLYISDYADDIISIVDTSTLMETSTISVGTNPKGLVLSPNGATLYVLNFTDSTLSVINTATNTVTQTVSLPGNSPSGISITPDGTSLYVSYLNSNFASAINTSTFVVTQITGVTGRQGSFGNFAG